MCAYSLDHITPSCLGVTGFGGTKPELEYNDSINKVSFDTRLSLYDTSWTFRLKTLATFQFSKNTSKASTPSMLQIFMCAQFRVLLLIRQGGGSGRTRTTGLTLIRGAL